MVMPLIILFDALELNWIDQLVFFSILHDTVPGTSWQFSEDSLECLLFIRAQYLQSSYS
jgi:hypothetical protein